MLRIKSLAILGLGVLAFGVPLCTNAQTATPKNKTAARQPLPSSSAAASQTASLEQRIEQYLRTTYAWGPAFVVSVSAGKPSPIKDLLEVPVTITMGGQSDTAVVYVSKDGRFMIRGELSDMSLDPFAEVKAKLKVGNSPSMGPENAKITLIEFADFECPSCRELDRILRNMLPNFPDVRLVYKHYPLTTIHPWAMTAAVASQCVIHQDPSLFWKMHDIIFDSQDAITPANVADQMNEYARQLNLDSDKFRGCMSDPQTTKEVEETATEGRSLALTGTPTTFINGRRVVGPDENAIKQALDFALNK